MEREGKGRRGSGLRKCGCRDRAGRDMFRQAVMQAGEPGVSAVCSGAANRRGRGRGHKRDMFSDALQLSRPARSSRRWLLAVLDFIRVVSKAGAELSLLIVVVKLFKSSSVVDKHKHNVPVRMAAVGVVRCRRNHEAGAREVEEAFRDTSQDVTTVAVLLDSPVERLTFPEGEHQRAQKWAC